MIYSPFFDGGIGIAFILLVLTGTLTLVFFVVAVFLEAIVLRSLAWGSFRRSLLDSFLVNLTTTVLGVLIGGLIWLVFVYDVPEMIVWLIGSYVISVGIEGIILWAMRRGPLRRALLVALIANLASYWILGGYFLATNLIL